MSLIEIVNKLRSEHPIRMFLLKLIFKIANYPFRWLENCIPLYSILYILFLIIIGSHLIGIKLTLIIIFLTPFLLLLSFALIINKDMRNQNVCWDDIINFLVHENKG